MLACFLGFTKRRQEAVSELHEGTSSRPVLEHYSLPFLDQMVAMVTTGTVISYAIYTVDSPLIGTKMMLTIPPVVYGIFRYLYLIYDRSDDRSTAAIVAEDRGVIIAGAVFVAVPCWSSTPSTERNPPHRADLPPPGKPDVRTGECWHAKGFSRKSET